MPKIEAVHPPSMASRKRAISTSPISGRCTTTFRQRNRQLTPCALERFANDLDGLGSGDALVSADEEEGNAGHTECAGVRLLLLYRAGMVV